MKLKILIAEDEPLEREGLTSLIKKFDPEMEIIEAETIPQFLGKAASVQLDIVLLDIRMPGGDGISALRQSRENGFIGEVIIITAFDVFKYAQDAMELDVLSFLLKPVEMMEIRDALQKACNKINKKNNQNQRLAKMQEIFVKNRGPLAQTLIQILLRDNKLSPEDGELAAELGFCERNGMKVFGIAAFLEAEEEYLPKYLLFMEIFDKFAEGSFLLPWKSYIAFLFCPCKCGSAEDIAHRILDVLTQNNLKGNIIYGGQISDFQKLPPLIEVLVERLEESLLKGLGQIHWDCEIQPRGNDLLNSYKPFEFEKYWMLLEDGIRNQMERTSKKGLEGFLKSLEGMEKELAKMICLGVLGRIAQLMLDLKCDSSSIRTWSRHSILDMISVSHEKDLYDRMYHCLEKAFPILSGPENPQVQILKKAMDKIFINLGNLSLETIADSIHVSPTYLSRLFRTRLDKRFVDVVKEARIEKAKVLLEEGVSVTDTTMAIGYTNVSYFSTLFKEQVGVNPASYKKPLQNR